jgi:hypothetical protein
MKNKNAVALGRRGGKAKTHTYPRRSEGDNGEGARKPRWPSKIQTLKNPCPFLECKITTATSTQMRLETFSTVSPE